MRRHTNYPTFTHESLAVLDRGGTNQATRPFLTLTLLYQFGEEIWFRTIDMQANLLQIQCTSWHRSSAKSAPICARDVFSAHLASRVACPRLVQVQLDSSFLLSCPRSLKRTDTQDDLTKLRPLWDF